MVKYFFVLFVCSLLKTAISQEEIKNKICVENANRDACQQISRTQEFTCLENVVSKIDCFINLEQKASQFTIVNAEEAFLAAALTSDNVVVIGEVKAVNAPIQTAVIVRKPYTGTFINLKGKRFCHPGFKHDELVSRLILEEFENKILNELSYCTLDNDTILEKRIKGLSNFFGASCRPGAWTEWDMLDAKLKTTYPSLCELCGVEKCDVTYQVPFNETLLCLTQKDGDVAVTTLADAKVFFETPENVNKYQYLCANGSVAEANNPCTWTNQLNRLIVTETTFVNTSKTYIINNLGAHISGATSTSTSTTLTLALQRLLELDTRDSIILRDPIPLSTFVRERRYIPRNDTSPCLRTIKFCTTKAAEQEKCFWFQRAAINSGMVPYFECRQTQYPENNECLNDIGNGNADTSFINANYGYPALRKNLTFVAYTETDQKQLSSVLIVLRSDTSIYSLHDLEGKRACFPEYGGKEWLAFMNVLINKEILTNSCDYGKIFSSFVGDSCAPGARDSSTHNISNTDEQRVCAQCMPVVNNITHNYCNADSKNKYFGSDGALTCLLDNKGDYAVITRNDVIQYIDYPNFRILSSNGSVSGLTTINVDDKASLNIINAGGVVVKSDNSKRDDIILLMLDIEQQFGQNLHKRFKIFEKFNGTKDLLFPDSTNGLTFDEQSNEYVENFKRLLSSSETCISDNPEDKHTTDIVGSVVTIFIIILIVVGIIFGIVFLYRRCKNNKESIEPEAEEGFLQ